MLAPRIFGAFAGKNMVNNDLQELDAWIASFWADLTYEERAKGVIARARQRGAKIKKHSLTERVLMATLIETFVEIEKYGR